MKNVKTEQKNSKSVNINYATKEDSIVKVSNVNISVLDSSLSGGNIVIAKDVDDSFYVTVSSFAGSNLLDPFKCYRKSYFQVTPLLETDNNSPTFSIKYNGIEPGVII